ncbi:YcgL domain-containing protein [Salinivibrio sp. MA351]|uniref:YcgL domain-containing protein BZJ21_00165 n=1 Tax=Salinivibrio costicola subsp. alcaliphilus TaxID=272773 RepID=A0ABX3KUR2_SALCS|nr:MULTISPECIES: YcgL domain-containing protein [Salinivibrio]NUY55538.1 YcgL domain-containing protein [Salinivibrio sp. EAGSL]OOE93798.1 YcgL domain-containing protein [Salinivibrio sp. AR647]OOE95831.1 YcgL domain-containing protein [Salinivibrio sp. AR640]OOE97174.1 YcgL domain-containing protein [Salinivibrio sp. MA351]OOE97278.1 YcgL domain-containing protein [Salinivibrio sp. IB643]
MYCAIYRSKKKEGTYLYLAEKDKFDDVPEALMNSFGQPEFAMMIDLDKREKLAVVNITKVKQSLQEEGFFVQLPPPPDVALQAIRNRNEKL